MLKPLRLLLAVLTACACAHAEGSGAVAERLTSVLVSSGSPVDFCNGDQMDSDGYRKTLTVERRVVLPAGATQKAQLSAVLESLSNAMCRQAVEQAGITVSAGVAHIGPVDAWAGVSIAMCSCRPELEVNLMRVPGVRRVEWDRP